MTSGPLDAKSGAMKSLCVYCASNLGSDPDFETIARSLGRELANDKIDLVYGGANVGLMGVIADSVLQHGGRAIGVLPRFLVEKEIAHKGLTELIMCETMHERKMKLMELSQGFLALPGGYGTMEEIFEVLTWHQLGLHKFPVAFLNVNGFFNPIRDLFDAMESNRLLKPQHRNMVIISDNISEALQRMKSYVAPEVTKWISLPIT